MDGQHNREIKKRIGFYFFGFLLILLLALGLRAAFIMSYDQGKMLKEIVYASDGVLYDEIASNFMAGKGFVFSETIYCRRMPLYPLFLAAVYSFSSHSVVCVRFVQAVMGALSCGMICLIGTKLFERKVGLLAGLIAAVDYSLLQLSAYVVSETLYICLLLSVIYFMCRYAETNSLLNVASLGLSVGLTVLCRETASLLAPVFLIWMWMRMPLSIKKKMIHTVIFSFTCLLLIVPWAARNYSIYKKFIPLTLGFGAVFYVSNNEAASYGGGEDALWPDLSKFHDLPSMYTPESDAYFREKALKFISENPGKTARLFVKKIVNMWRPYYASSRKISKLVMFFSYLPEMVFGFWGLILARRRKETAFLVMVLGVSFILHCITAGGIRYRYPLMPIFIIYAAFAADHLWKEFRKRFWKAGLLEPA